MSRRFPWAEWSDEALLQLPLKALKVAVADTWLEDCLADLNAELAQRDLRVRPHGPHAPSLPAQCQTGS